MDLHQFISTPKSPSGSEPPEHSPDVVVITCADARVKLQELLPGLSTFEIRVAGNSVSPGALSSINYAVAHLGVQQVLVLGHTSCGAVGAWCDGIADQHLLDFIKPIETVMSAAGYRPTSFESPTQAAAANAIGQAELIMNSDSRVGEMIKEGSVQVLAAVADISASSPTILPASSLI